MKVDEWLSFFKNHPQKKMYSLSDISLLVNEPKASLNVQLTRLVQAKILTRVAQRWYANPFHLPTAEEVAMILRVPSYLSLEYALARQGVLSQRVYTLTLMTTRPPYTFHGSQGTFEYHQLKKSLFWGYQTNQEVNIATPEKALLDLLYIRTVRTKELNQQGIRSLFDDMHQEMLHQKVLQRYAKRFGGHTKQLALSLGIITT